MISQRNILISLLFIVLLLGVPKSSMSGVSLYPQDIHIGFEYDDNVTRERAQEDYQYGIVSRLTTGFGIGNFVPIKGLDTAAEYTLRMRDVNTTNDEDYSSQKVLLSSKIMLKTGTRISLEENFELWNSQNDLFYFFDNVLTARISQSLGKNTTVALSYNGRQKWFQNKAPEVQARNFFRHQMDLDIFHRLSSDFTAQIGYAHGISIYNRSPIEFSDDRAIALDGVQRDRQNVFTLGGDIFLLNNKIILSILNQIVRSHSNSRSFNFDGNRTEISLQIAPFDRMLIDFTYRIVAYNLGVYQTPDSGYELTEPTSKDQSGIILGATYDIADQVALQLDYRRIENTVFFTKEFYKENIFGIGMKVKF